MDIAHSEPDYVTARIGHVGYVDPYGLEGIAILKSDSGGQFHIRSFSGEVAGYIMRFLGDSRDEIPTVYRMIEEICESNGLVLVKVKVYDSSEVLRANLYFTGRDGDMVLRNYRASDALALAAFYNIPILVRRSLLKASVEA